MQRDHLEEYTEQQIDFLVDVAQERILPLFNNLLGASSQYECVHRAMTEVSGPCSVYVVLLHADSRNLRSKKKRLGEVDMPCVYVGQTAHPPQVRFAKHIYDDKASEYPRDYGLALLPYFQDNLNSLCRNTALVTEARLADALHEIGCTVFGGH